MTHERASLEELGRFIRTRRTTLGLTQTQFAERLGWAQERISILENGKYGMPSLPALARLANSLEIPLLALLEAAGYAGQYTDSDDTGIRTQESNALQYTLQRLLEIDASTLKDALNQASDQMAEAMGADKVDAFIFDPPSRTLVALGTSNTPMGRLQHASGLERHALANRGRTVEVYETGITFCTGDARQDPGIPPGVKEVLGVQSMLAVPLRVDDTIQGVLAAESSRLNHFGEEELRFFQAAAHWVGMVARRAELTEAMRQSVAEEARRMAADEVITALAHDLGNALTPLKGRLDILRRRFQHDSRTSDLEQIQDASRSLATIQQMITRLLDSARLDQGLFSLALQPLNVADVIEQVVADMRPSWEAIHLRVVETLEVEGDPVRLTEVLVNLLTNAIQHSPAGAPITVTADAEQRDDGSWAVISVTDHGPGIESEMLPRVFERFATGNRSDGLGLGLYLSHRIVEAHGGTLTVESSVGTGTTFWLALPCRGR